MTSFSRDVAYAVRTLTGKPWLSLAIILTLALGIGANTAMFTVVNAVLLRPLPYKNGDRLVRVWSDDRKNPTALWVSYPDYLDIRAQSHALENLTAWFRYEMVLTGTFKPERVQAAVVFGDMFSVLGVPPKLGATFRAEALGSQERVIVLSHRLWAERFGSDPTLVGRSVTLSGNSYRVAGVMPRGFQFPIQTPPIDVWATLGSEQFGDTPQRRRNARGLEAMGRLRDGVDLESARAELNVIVSRLTSEYPESNKDIGIRIMPAAEHVVEHVSRPLLILFAAVGCVLLIACVNVANLLLARATDRRREIALRSALGASRRQIVVELAIESLILALAGGIAGGLLAMWGGDALLSLVPGELPRADEIGVDRFVLAFTVLVSLLTGVTFGLAPAWHVSNVDLTIALQHSGRTTSDSASARTLRGALVVAEFALAMILLTGATLFITSFWRLNQQPEGVDPHNVLTFDVTWPWERYSRERAAEKFRELQSRLLAIRGIRGAAAGLQLPDRGGPATEAVFPYLEVDEGQVAESQRPRTGMMRSQPGYFRTLGIPLVKGRDFNDHDTLDAPRVVIINESLARTYFHDENPVGKWLKLDLWLLFGDQKPRREIVGVVADVTHRGVGTTARPLVYVPLAQVPFNMSYLVVKTNGDPSTFVGAIRDAVHAVDPDQPIYDVTTLEDRIGMSVAQERFSALLLTIFSALALGLAAMGLYGVLSYTVGQRTREIGLRCALGATGGDVLRSVVLHGMKLIAIGLALGTAGALALTGLVDGMLFGVTASDPFTRVIALSVLTVVAIAACWIPARRATKVEPIVALRYE
jgi:putative ABC transport system permease protein